MRSKRKEVLPPFLISERSYLGFEDKEEGPSLLVNTIHANLSILEGKFIFGSLDTMLP